MNKEPITVEGIEKLKKELEELKNIKRPQIVKAIAEARGHGDLKENAEYHAAKEEQSKIETRVIEINDLIARANIIDVTKLEKKDDVIFGSTVHLVDLETKEPSTASYERSDVAVIPAAGVIAEAMAAITIASAFLEKFGGDSLGETRRNVEGFQNQVRDY